MADEIFIDPASFAAASDAVGQSLVGLRNAWRAFDTVMGDLGDFLGNDDAGQQLKAEYNPASADFRAAMRRLVDVDLPALETSLRNDGISWTNADTALFGD